MNQEAKIIISITIATVLLLVGAVFFLSKSTPLAGAVDSQYLIRQDSNRLTTENTPVIIVEFGDYQCPACAAAQPIVNKILEQYPGRINLVFRHFPLPQHANAIKAAEAAEAAGSQGKYWQMHRLLYQNQTKWAEVSNPQDLFLTYAGQIGLNTDQFISELDSQKSLSKITADKKDGESLQVNATPTFYINGVKLNSFSESEFKSRIDHLLTK